MFDEWIFACLSGCTVQLICRDNLFRKAIFIFNYQNTNINTNAQNFKCHNSGGVGHFKKNCTSPILSTGKQEYPNLKKESVDKNDPPIKCYKCIEKGIYCKNVKCFSCNKYGHYAKKMP